MCNKMMKKDKSEMRKNMFETYDKTENTRDMFKLTRTLLNWKYGKSPSSFWKDGKRTRKPQEIADIQNNYFNKKVRKLLDGLPAGGKDPTDLLRRTMEKWRTRNYRREMEMKEIGELDILKIMNSMGSSTAMGHDRMDSLSLKIAAGGLYKQITRIINMSIREDKGPP